MIDETTILPFLQTINAMIRSDITIPRTEWMELSIKFKYCENDPENNIKFMFYYKYLFIFNNFLVFHIHKYPIQYQNHPLYFHHIYV